MRHEQRRDRTRTHRAVEFNANMDGENEYQIRLTAIALRKKGMSYPMIVIALHHFMEPEREITHHMVRSWCQKAGLPGLPRGAGRGEPALKLLDWPEAPAPPTSWQYQKEGA